MNEVSFSGHEISTISVRLIGKYKFNIIGNMYTTGDFRFKIQIFDESSCKISNIRIKEVKNNIRWSNKQKSA